MVEVMFQQGSWEDCRIMMGAIVDIQIPGVSDESAGQNSASRGQVDNAEGEPYLPEDPVDSVLRARVMNPVLDWGDSM
jgi:hypothetical protein